MLVRLMATAYVNSQMTFSFVAFIVSYYNLDNSISITAIREPSDIGALAFNLTKSD